MSLSAPSKMLVVIADGTRAVLFDGVRKGQGWSLRQVEELQPKDLANDGPAGVRPPESSAQETDQATFAKQLAQHLNSKALSNAFENVTLIVDPETLGQMRRSYHKVLQAKIFKAIDKNVMAMETGEIETLLDKTMDI